MAPTPNSFTLWGGASATPVTSGTISWNNGDVLVVMAGEDGTAATTWTISNTGSGLSWTQKVNVGSSGGSDCPGSVWVATATATSSGTITVGRTGGGDVVAFCAVWAGGTTSGIGNTAGAAVVASGGTDLLAMTTSAGSAVLFCMIDFNATTPGNWTPTSNNAHNASTPGPTALPSSGIDGTKYSWDFLVLDSSASGSHNYGIASFSGGTPFATILICEVLAVASTTLPLISRPSRARTLNPRARTIVGSTPVPTIPAPRPAKGAVSRARTLLPSAQLHVGRPPPPTIPAPRSATPVQVERAKFLLPPDRTIIGRPPPPTIPAPRSARPPDVTRAKFLLPRDHFIDGFTPPPTIPAPRPARPAVTRARTLLPRSDFLQGRTPASSAPPRPALAVVVRSRFLLPSDLFRTGRPPPPTVPAPRSATPRQIVRALFLLPPDRLLVGRPPPLPPGPPRSQPPPPVVRARFLLPSAHLLLGRPPPPPLAPPRPAPGSVTRARVLLIRARTLSGRTILLVVTSKSGWGIVE